MTAASLAQEAPLDGVEIGPSGEAYAASIRLRGINTEVGYYDPSRPAPELTTNETPTADRELSGNGLEVGQVAEGTRVVVIVLCAVILLAIAWLIASFGGRLPVSFARDPDGGKAGASLRTAAAQAASSPIGLDAILSMADKREALVALCKSLLARSMTAQGVLFQRSWTDRDALRRVPADTPHREALRALVLASERVQFGGRDVTEAEFREHVERVRPLWAGATG